MFERIKELMSAPATFEVVEERPVLGASKRTKRTSKRKRKSSAPRESSLLATAELLAEHQGKAFKQDRIAKALGYKNQSHPSRLVSELTEMGVVKVQAGKNHVYHYYVDDKRLQQLRKAVAVTMDTRKSTRPESKLENKRSLTVFQRKVLRFISAHQNQLLGGEQIARGADVPGGTVYSVIVTLCRKGLIERSGPTPEGTRYRVVGESTNTEQPERRPNPQAASDDGKTGEAQVFQVVESLIWDFLKETWSTNLLQFRKWLQQKVK